MAEKKLETWVKRARGKAKSLSPGRANPDLHQQGLVFNVQKFSIHDGPGIRTTVFMKGCPLGCPWCSNPESINPDPELITKFDTLCKDCGRCQEVCEAGAIKVSECDGPGRDGAREHTRLLDRDLCDRCMKCALACPSGALSAVGKKKTVAQVLEVVEQDMPFYRTSGGGITLSGGEPLMQPDFALALLRESKRRGLHAVLDTCGHAARDVWEEALPLLDLVLYDIKHTDPVIHMNAVGADNRLILENLRFISGRVPVWMRVPLIPGFNDGEAALSGIVALAGELSPQKLFFLPYHAWGSAKYAGLGRDYVFIDASGVSDKILKMLEELCEKEYVGDYNIESS